MVARHSLVFVMGWIWILFHIMPGIFKKKEEPENGHHCRLEFFKVSGQVFWIVLEGESMNAFHFTGGGLCCLFHTVEKAKKIYSEMELYISTVTIL